MSHIVQEVEKDPQQTLETYRNRVNPLQQCKGLDNGRAYHTGHQLVPWWLRRSIVFVRSPLRPAKKLGKICLYTQTKRRKQTVRTNPPKQRTSLNPLLNFTQKVLSRASTSEVWQLILADMLKNSRKICLTCLIFGVWVYGQRTKEITVWIDFWTL